MESNAGERVGSAVVQVPFGVETVGGASCRPGWVLASVRSRPGRESTTAAGRGEPSSADSLSRGGVSSARLRRGKGSHTWREDAQKPNGTSDAGGGSNGDAGSSAPGSRTKRRTGLLRWWAARRSSRGVDGGLPPHGPRPARVYGVREAGKKRNVSRIFLLVLIRHSGVLPGQSSRASEGGPLVADHAGGPAR